MKTLSALLFSFFLCTLLQAQVPHVLSYQGVLLDNTGNAKPDGEYTLTFSLYSTETGGTAIWSESKQLQVNKGLITIQLGDHNPFSPGIDFRVPYWLGIKVDEENELIPRLVLTSSAYSLVADTALKIKTPLNLAGNGNYFVLTGTNLGTGSAIKGETNNSSGFGIYGSNTGGGTAIYGTSDAGAAVIGTSKTWSGLYGETGTWFGVWGKATGENGKGVFGESASSYGVWGKSTNSSGVVGESENWVGVFGSGGNQAGVWGEGNPGVYGKSSDIGVSGLGSTGVSGKGGLIGVYGEGLNAAVKGVGTYVGIWGESTSAEANTYAGYFKGNVTVTGTLTKAAGSFRIDNPVDPANEYLSHSFVESPDMKNIYDGIVTTDSKGQATVVLPDWFQALNKDFRYQLTTIGQQAQAWIESEIENNRFSIQSDKPNVKISWMVTGIRHDPYANDHRIPVTEDKTKDKGTYLYPEGYQKTAKK
jgi:hypothetical protein